MLKDDIPDLVSPANVNRAVLQTWCEEVASYAGLPKSASLVPIVRADGSVQPDTAIFDFSRKFRAVVPVRVFASSKDMTNDDLLWSCKKAKERKKKRKKSKKRKEKKRKEKKRKEKKRKKERKKERKT